MFWLFTENCKQNLKFIHPFISPSDMPIFISNTSILATILIMRLAVPKSDFPRVSHGETKIPGSCPDLLNQLLQRWSPESGDSLSHMNFLGN
jgi:hypothetical protein